MTSEKVKDIFSKARKYAPSVIFIDEIDAVGKTRTGLGFKEDVLESLFVEMDGFTQHRDRPVFVLGATNYGAMKDDRLKLDTGLLRRFNSRIYVGAPDKAARLKYLKLVRRKKGYKALSDGVLESIAERSVGQTIATLEQIYDQLYRDSVKKNRDIDDSLLTEVYEEFFNGEEKHFSKEYYEKTAIHEAGHVYVSYVNGITPSFVTISSRGDYGGYMQKEIDEENPEYTRDDLLKSIRITLAGRLAEKEFYSDQSINTGASSDLRQATNIALSLICTYGMEEDMYMTVSPNEVLMSPFAKEYMDKVNAIIKREMELCEEQIKAGHGTIRRLADALLEKTYLRKDELIKILN